MQEETRLIIRTLVPKWYPEVCISGHTNSPTDVFLFGWAGLFMTQDCLVVPVATDSRKLQNEPSTGAVFVAWTKKTTSKFKGFTWIPKRSWIRKRDAEIEYIYIFRHIWYSLWFLYKMTGALTSLHVFIIATDGSVDSVEDGVPRRIRLIKGWRRQSLDWFRYIK